MKIQITIENVEKKTDKKENEYVFLLKILKQERGSKKYVKNKKKGMFQRRDQHKIKVLQRVESDYLQLEIR